MLPGTVCFSQTVGVDSSEAVFKADRACCDTGMVGDLLERSGFPGGGAWEDKQDPSTQTVLLDSRVQKSMDPKAQWSPLCYLQAKYFLNWQQLGIYNRGINFFKERNTEMKN
jgi:hypothetical protein